MTKVGVVMIDDEIRALKHLRRLLEANLPACRILAQFTDPRLALKSPEIQRADIVFVDIMMPVMDGLVFSEALLRKNPQAKIILLTAYRDFDYAKRALRLGVFDYWVKHELHKDNIAEQMRRVLKAVGASRNAADSVSLAIEESEAILAEEYQSIRVRRICAYIRKHISEDLQLKTLSREFNLSGDHLRKSFKNKTGLTISEYITGERIREAARLLKTGELKVYEIAERVGYNSPHYFSQAFHKVMGCYPTDYTV